MEASIVTTESPRVTASKEAASSGSSIEWLGWVLAAAFFILLMRLQLRLRRQEGLVLKRDRASTLNFPPVGNRRRRPR